MKDDDSKLLLSTSLMNEEDLTRCKFIIFVAVGCCVDVDIPPLFVTMAIAIFKRWCLEKNIRKFTITEGSFVL